ncbi:HEAT repeat domain-containing protein [Thalassoroseus pseudoceratinae]|uniref:HEAT repeat domain-containing protein n=1 Tax=Thalassoroseus pseudoceratinae TaxID=2713176 RepID=UPI0014206453|nr:HEAT repeat domain-containing protein [Thalassoroseus pseudoceratinae]
MNSRNQRLRARGRRIAGVFVSACMCGLWPATLGTSLAEAADPSYQRSTQSSGPGLLNLEALVKKRPVMVLPSRESKPTTLVKPSTPASDLFEVVEQSAKSSATVSTPKAVRKASTPVTVPTVSLPVTVPTQDAVPKPTLRDESQDASPIAQSVFETEWTSASQPNANVATQVSFSSVESPEKIDPGIQNLISELTAEDHEIRQMAAFTLGESGEDAKVALPALRQSMFSNYTMVRLHAAEAVAKLNPGDDVAIEVLLRGLRDVNSEVRVMAATALFSVAPAHQADAVTVLKSLQNDPNEHVRLLAETALPIEEIQQPAPMPQEAYELPRRTVEVTPVDAEPAIEEESVPGEVSEISSQPVVEPQADAFDEHFTSPQSTSAALPPESNTGGLTPSESSVLAAEPVEKATASPTLSPELADLATRLGSADPIQQKYALSELVWFGSEARAVLPQVQTCLASSDEVVRAHAAKALHEIAPEYDRQAVSVLTELVGSVQPGVSPLAAYFLGEFDSKALLALPALREAMASSVGLDKLHVAEAILRIEPQDANAAATLVQAVADEDESSRFFAACALVAAAPYHDDIIVPALTTAQSDSSARVRMAADTTLTGYLTEPKGVATVVVAEPAEDVPTFDTVEIQQQEVTQFDQPTEEVSPLEPAVNEVQDPGPSQVQLVQVEVPVPDTSNQPANVPGEPAADSTPTELDTNIPVQKWTARTPGELKPIRYVTINTAPKRRDEDGRLQELPTNYGAAYLEQQGQTRTGQESRPWIVTSKSYEAPAYCHRPLYFEETNLERYGHHWHGVQPLVSAAHFYGRIPFMPYLATVSKPWECEYPLGKYRPGSCSPFQHELVPLRADAALVQVGAMAVPFFIIH